MKKILVIDDETRIVLVIQKRLEANGYQVVTASFGGEGIEKAEADQPNLILLDVMMPGGLNGYNTLQKLKESAKTRHIPVIMFTAKNYGDDIKRAIEMGAIDYIIKPFDPPLLLEKIRLAIS